MCASAFMQACPQNRVCSRVADGAVHVPCYNLRDPSGRMESDTHVRKAERSIEKKPAMVLRMRLRIECDLCATRYERERSRNGVFEMRGVAPALRQRVVRVAHCARDVPCVGRSRQCHSVTLAKMDI